MTRDELLVLFRNKSDCYADSDDGADQAMSAARFVEVVSELLGTDDDVVWGLEDKVVYLNNGEKAFRCDCGCNVFKQAATDPTRYKCNGCGATYTGEG